MHKTTTFLFVMAVACVSAAAFGLSGCSSKDSSTGSNAAQTTCFDYSSYSGTTPARSFKSDVLPILRRSCGLSASCHGDPGQSLANQPFYGPSMSDPDPTSSDIAEIFVSFFKASGENPTMPLVTPGDPSKSFLMYKLDGEVLCSKLGCAGASTCGTPMPQTSPSLPGDELEIFRSWIKQGAKNDFDGASGGGGSTAATTTSGGGASATGSGGAGGK